jgi:hypothetical protein
MNFNQLCQLSLVKSTSLASSLLATSGVLIGSSLLAAPADAFSLSFDNTSTTSNPTATGASALVDFNFTQQGSNILLGLNITNTTGTITPFGDGATLSKLTGIGFDLINGVSVVPGSYTGSSFFPVLALNGMGDTTLSPFGTFDIAVLDNNNFEGGNANSALPEGQSTSVSFLLSGTNLLASTVESDFFAGFSDGSLRAVTRFQQVNAGEESDKLLLGDDGIIDDGTVDDGTVDDGTVDDGTVDDGTVDDGTVDDGTVDDGTVDDGTVDDGTVDDGTVDDGTVDDGTVDDGTVDDGTVDDGTVDDGTVDDGTVDDGTVDDGTVDDGTVDDGTVDDGTVDDGTVDDGTGDDGTVDDGTVDDGTVDGGTVDDGTDDGMTEIPEPTTVGGLLFFLGGLLASRRKSS